MTPVPINEKKGEFIPTKERNEDDYGRTPKSSNSKKLSDRYFDANSHYSVDFNPRYRDKKYQSSIKNLIQRVSIPGPKAKKEYEIVGGLFYGGLALIEVPPFSSKQVNSVSHPSHIINIPWINGSVSCLHVEKDSSQVIISFVSNLNRPGYSKGSQPISY